MFVRFRIEKISNTGDGKWDSSTVAVDDAYDVVVNRSIGDSKDVFSFKIPNPNNRRISDFKAQDKINIYYLINGASYSSSNLLINGLIKKVTETSDEKGKHIKIEGISFSELITNALIFTDLPSGNVMQFFYQALVNTKIFNNKFGIDWDTSNPTVKSDGSAFPVWSIKEFYKSFNSVLDKYLVNDWTGDGNYFWFVTKDNKLSIRRRSVTTNNVVITEGVDYKTAKFDVNADDVKNFIIVKCGNDFNENPVTTRFDNASSRAKYGFKYYMLIDTQITQKLKDSGLYDGDNDALVAEATNVGFLKARDYAVAHDKGFRKITVTMEPTLDYDIGNKISITAPSYNLTNEGMRVKEINFDIEGTTLYLEEEVASI